MKTSLDWMFKFPPGVFMDIKESNLTQNHEHEYCETCIYYTPHYVFHNGAYLLSVFGHCSYPKLKTRKSSSLACDHFKKRNIIKNQPS